MKVNVIKIGGNIVDNEEALDAFLEKLANLEGLKVLVHGGGKVATQVSKALGIETQMIEGRRVTDEETIKVVTMVYAGLVNKTIVAKLQALDVDAIGLSGADNNVIRSHKRQNSEVDYGFVGDVDRVNNGFLTFLLEKDLLPVLAPITHDKKGLLLNTNADTIAAETAIALSESCEVTLTYCFELPGVMKDISDPSSVIPLINFESYKQLKAGNIIADGMIPKMDNCFHAIDKGVRAVKIINAKDLGDFDNSGTKLVWE